MSSNVYADICRYLISTYCIFLKSYKEKFSNKQYLFTIILDSFKVISKKPQVNQVVPYRQPLLMCIYYALFLVAITIMTTLFHIMHKQAHHWLTCWPLGSSGTGTIHSSMHLSSWSMHYALLPSWYCQACVVSLLLKLMHLTTVLVGSCNRTRNMVYSLLFITVISSLVHHKTMQPMSVSY